jgi:hypothetical protein
MIENLTDENYMIYAAKVYDRPNIIQSEFEEDLNRIQYIKRLLTKYYTSKKLKERLILNHLVIFYNVFGPEAGTRMLFLRLEIKDIEVLKPFMIYLSMLPEVVRGIKGKNINTDVIKMDKNAIKALRELK